MSRLPTMLRGCLVAARFLTRVPLPDLDDANPETLGRSALCYPLIGLTLGAVLVVLWLIASGLSEGAAPLAIAALLLIGWTWLTGGLHLDGLADCADAWVGGLGSRERTVAILKDPHTGAMGVIALVLILLVKFAALASLPSGAEGVLILLLTPALARAQLLALPLSTDPARPDGMGAALHRVLPRRLGIVVLTLTASATLIAFSVADASAAGVALLGVAGLLLLVWRRSLLHRLGGFTGDTAGALVELTEAAVLMTAVLVCAA